jgi:hypothetical protein
MSRIQSIAMLVLAAITGATTVVGETTWSVATGHSRVIFDANRLSELRANRRIHQSGTP